ncbi:MAG TPA: pseudouridine synthase [Bacteroidia bacterium]|nr:pseudouridine synthase [Bacteroidia bacterium]HNP99780.1 pseudouridine synthase [Bacteroidia bacterium]
MHRYFVIYKPYGMLSQFSKEGDKQVLADLNFIFPKDVYPVGRLDADSEGMLLLTNDKSVNEKLLHPSKKHVRSYLVQVEGEFSVDACEKLKKGVEISVDGKKYKTLPADNVELIPDPEFLPERNPPVRFRKSIPTSWVQIDLIEGKNRQVRKMTAAVGFPTLRLVRIVMESLKLDFFNPGEIKELERSIFYSKLKLS